MRGMGENICGCDVTLCRGCSNHDVFFRDMDGTGIMGCGGGENKSGY